MAHELMEVHFVLSIHCPNPRNRIFVLFAPSFLTSLASKDSDKKGIQYLSPYNRATHYNHFFLIILRTLGPGGPNTSLEGTSVSFWFLFHSQVGACAVALSSKVGQEPSC